MGDSQELDVDDLDTPIILFDGVCNLCNGFVQFVIENDSDGTLSFASLQSELGSDLLAHFDLPEDKADSIVLIQDGTYYEKSDAALKIASHLDGAYRYASVLQCLPRFIRDRAYMIVSNNRYTIFGQREQCMMPTPENQSRFLTDTDN